MRTYNCGIHVYVIALYTHIIWLYTRFIVLIRMRVRYLCHIIMLRCYAHVIRVQGISLCNMCALLLRIVVYLYIIVLYQSLLEL